MVNKKEIKKPRQFVAFLAMTKASVLMSLRNPTSLFFNFLFPFIFITIFGLLSWENAKFDLVVKPNSMRTGIVYEALEKVDALNLVTDKSEEEIQEGLRKGQIAVTMDVQEVGSINIAPGVDMPVYDVHLESSAGAPQAANSITSIVNAVIGQINASVSQNAPKIVNESQSVVEGRKYQQIDFVLPGQLAFALLSNALFGISFTIMMYKKNLILKRFFATPVRKFNILGAEVLSKTLIAILQSVIIIAAGYFLFHFTLANGWTTVFSMLVLSLIGIIVFLAFGLLAASIAKNEDSLTPITQLFLMPQIFLSGAFFSIESFPKFIQPIAHVLPMTLLNEAFKKVAFEGVALSATLPQIGGLLAWGVGLYILVLILFKWE